MKEHELFLQEGKISQPFKTVTLGYKPDISQFFIQKAVYIYFVLFNQCGEMVFIFYFIGLVELVEDYSAYKNQWYYRGKKDT